MRQFISLVSVLILAASMCTFAAKKQGNYVVPGAEDFTGTPTKKTMDHLDSLWSACANILPSSGAKVVDGIQVDSARITTGTITTANITTANVSGIITGNVKFDSILVNTDGSETVTAAQTGMIFVSTKSDGATTYTLPDATAAINGCIWYFFQTANQNMVVTATTADNNDFVADAVATSDQVSAATASHLIGAGIMVIGANSKYYAFAMNTECPLTVEAAD